MQQPNPPYAGFFSVEAARGSSSSSAVTVVAARGDEQGEPCFQSPAESERFRQSQERCQAAEEEARRLKEHSGVADEVLRALQRKSEEQELRVRKAEELALHAEVRAQRADEQGLSVQSLVTELRGEISRLGGERSSATSSLEHQIQSLHQAQGGSVASHASQLEVQRQQQASSTAAMMQQMRRLEQKQEENQMLAQQFQELQRQHASGVARLEQELERERTARRAFQSSSAASFEQLSGVGALAEQARMAVEGLEQRLDRRLAAVELKLSKSDKDSLKNMSFPGRIMFLQNQRESDKAGTENDGSTPQSLSQLQGQRSTTPTRGLMHLQGRS